MSPRKETRARGCSIRHMQMQSTIAARSSSMPKGFLRHLLSSHRPISNHPFPNYRGTSSPCVSDGIGAKVAFVADSRLRRRKDGFPRRGPRHAMLCAVCPRSSASHRIRPRSGPHGKRRRHARWSRSKSQIPSRYLKNRYLISAAAPRMSTTTTSSKMADSSQFQTI